MVPALVTLNGLSSQLIGGATHTHHGLGSLALCPASSSPNMGRVWRQRKLRRRAREAVGSRVSLIRAVALGTTFCGCSSFRIDAVDLPPPRAAAFGWPPRGDIEATRKAHDAIAEHDRLPMPFERARTQLLLRQLLTSFPPKSDSVQLCARPDGPSMGWARRCEPTASGPNSLAPKAPIRDLALKPSERRGGSGHDQPGLRGRTVHQPEDRRSKPWVHLPQARHQLTCGTRPPHRRALEGNNFNRTACASARTFAGALAVSKL
jgi:hypothetical protein